MAGPPLGPGRTTACVPGQNSEWWCGAQQMLYQEWLRVDSDMKRQGDTSRVGNGEGTGSNGGLYIGAGAAMVAAVVAILWLLGIAVQGSVKRREKRNRILHAQGGYGTEDVEHALAAEREEREQGHAPTYE